MSKHIAYAALAAPGNPKTMTSISSRDKSNFKTLIQFKKFGKLSWDLHLRPAFWNFSTPVSHIFLPLGGLTHAASTETENYVRSLK